MAADCVVSEDSKEDMRGSRRAGMKCLVVTNSHLAELLNDADAVVKSLEDVNPNFLPEHVPVGSSLVKRTGNRSINQTSYSHWRQTEHTGQTHCTFQIATA